MKEINKIRLIEFPKEEFNLNNENMASLLGGAEVYCPGTFKDGGLFGGDYCSSNFNSGNCGNSTDYCGQYKSCTLRYVD